MQSGQQSFDYRYNENFIMLVYIFYAIEMVSGHKCTLNLEPRSTNVITVKYKKFRICKALSEIDKILNYIINKISCKKKKKKSLISCKVMRSFLITLYHIWMATWPI